MVVKSELADTELIDQVRSGSTRAYQTLVERHQDYVYTISYRIMGNREDAEEVSQDVFVKAYNGLKNFQGHAKFTSWIYRIAMNTAISYRRKKKIPLETIEDYKQFDQGEISNMVDYQRLEQRKFLQIALNSMLPDDVSVLTLFYFKELSLEEMSEITGIGVNTLKVKLFRARKRLSTALNRILKNEVNSLI
ncbi:MAG: DNA-directed RNA polymerase sigma-70 factor [Cyclobacteriaceae bacterium]|nr:MAG: DNA-directed RNA polymerase sigma-70 factor [Cyclobacteriaceae bacterium]